MEKMTKENMERIKVGDIIIIIEGADRKVGIVKFNEDGLVLIDSVWDSSFWGYSNMYIDETNILFKIVGKAI